MDHVKRVLHYLGLREDMFEDLLEYYQMRADCKPNMGSYEMIWKKVVAKHPTVAKEDCVFFDDAKVNLIAAKKFGFTTVLVNGKGKALFLFF